MKHIVMFSGGVGSYLAARRLIDRGVPRDEITLLFADTLIEDSDLYRFLDEAAAKLDCELVKIKDGRTPWEVFKDQGKKGFLGNNRVDLCSQILKRDLLNKWRGENCPPDVVTNFGIDWSEKHRLDRLAPYHSPWRVAAPLCDPPFLTKGQQLDALCADGIKRPRLYDLGFPHNNCGGGCVKAGMGHFRHLLKTLPEVFFEWERKEEELRNHIGKDVSILKRRRNGQAEVFTLRQLREEVENDPQLSLFADDRDDWGGCGCAVE